jgi:hypothetical protein
VADTPASAARIRRAWRAGLRGRSTWLTAGISCVIASVVLRGWTPQLDAPAIRVRAVLAGQGAEVFAYATALAQDALGLLAMSMAIVLSAVVIAALALGRIGPIDSEAAQGLGIVEPPLRLRIGVGLGALLLAVLSLELRGRIAGAARAADAGASGLLALWHGSAVQLLGVLGLAMTAVGVLEAWWYRHDRLLALRPSVEQARAEARERGGRRR